MVKYCSVSDCRSTSKRCDPETVWFVPMPKPWIDLARANRWIYLCDRNKNRFKITKEKFVCSLHFKHVPMTESMDWKINKTLEPNTPRHGKKLKDVQGNQRHPDFRFGEWQMFKNKQKAEEEEASMIDPLTAVVTYENRKRKQVSTTSSLSNPLIASSFSIDNCDLPVGVLGEDSLPLKIGEMFGTLNHDKCTCQTCLNCSFYPFFKHNCQKVHKVCLEEVQAQELKAKKKRLELSRDINCSSVAPPKKYAKLRVPSVNAASLKKDSMSTSLIPGTAENKLSWQEGLDHSQIKDA